MIRLTDVAKQYGTVTAVSRLSFEVSKGELVVLLGESGCGKTTTLKMINRLIEPSSGQIYIKDALNTRQDPVKLRRSIGYVFQGIGLFPHMTVAENIGIIPKLVGWNEEKRSRRIEELMHLFNLAPDEFRDRTPANLSGGQKQRVGVARALAIEPEIMLMDEPFGALDPLTRMNLQQEYQQIRKSLSITTVFVTHDMTEALLLGDRIAVMDAGELLQIGTPKEVLTNPVNEYVEELFRMPKTQADRIEELLES